MVCPHEYVSTLCPAVDSIFEDVIVVTRPITVPHPVEATLPARACV